MSVSLMMAVRNDHDPRLTPSLKLTLITLASYHSEKFPDRGVAPKTDRIAMDTGFSPRRVQEHLNELETLGKVLVERPSPKRRGRLYVLRSNASSRVSDTRDVAVGNATGRGATSQVREDKPEQTTEPLRGSAALSAAEENQMPDNRLHGGEPEFEDTPAPTKTRKKVTGHGTAVTFFTNQAKQVFRIDRVNMGLLRKTVALLHDDGLSYDEVIDYMQWWLLREDANIRSKRSVASREPFDLAVYFRQSLNSNMVEVWKREQSSTSVNSAFGAKSMNEKLGL